MTNFDIGPVLVTGASGNQGGAVVRALLQTGRPVRALVRNPDAASAQALAAQGVEVVKGDFDDAASLDAALVGVAGVFSMQMPSPPNDPESEIRTGKALIEAAHRSGVHTIVHTSVARAGDQESFIGWNEGRWEPTYWEGKAAVNELVKEQGFRNWVILKPALMMHNLLPPVADFMFPSLSQTGEIDTAFAPDTKVDWIAAEDIGAFAAAAFADPERFHGHEIDLAAEAVTMNVLAAKIAEATGKPVSAVASSKEELVARGYHAGVVDMQVWSNVEGYKVDLDAVRRWGVPLTSLDAFVERNRDRFAIG
ncbi:uncharacterized protein YbjT (DUF2867 family) [Sphingomonas insulae]|uniref:NmrA-like domain-containing protein n=1 Tax=Sphingomonas insulae TaxID=424800 RepID=A0ABN1HZT6_9SPHN|nr:NmrA family NAD(P)-binding protein [Sphingomonas insulae]NIJ31019.1 uncharacterized protein YbjT (DUF2867 family) [Sphingomonas insulae]